eukprot:9328137-Pyramimonas_sp.AAC.1
MEKAQTLRWLAIGAMEEVFGEVSPGPIQPGGRRAQTPAASSSLIGAARQEEIHLPGRKKRVREQDMMECEDCGWWLAEGEPRQFLPRTP